MRPCPDCAFVNESSDRFCGGCGRGLNPDGATAPNTQVQANGPNGGPVAADRRPFATGSQSSGERRRITVMFCDVVDFTLLSSSMDPEDLSAVIRSYQSCVATTINPLEEAVYLLLQAIRAPIATRTRVATIQVNLVRILRFISCERAQAFPGRRQPGMNTI